MGKHTRIVQALKASPSGLTIQEISIQTDLPPQLVFCVIEGVNHCQEFEKFQDKGQTLYQLTQTETEP
jgi:hypothetical protein